MGLHEHLVHVHLRVPESMPVQHYALTHGNHDHKISSNRSFLEMSRVVIALVAAEALVPPQDRITVLNQFCSNHGR